MRPSTDMSILNERLDMIEAYLNPLLTETVKEIRSHLKYIIDLTPLFEKMEIEILSPKEWNSLYEMLTHALKLAYGSQHLFVSLFLILIPLLKQSLISA